MPTNFIKFVKRSPVNYRYDIQPLISVNSHLVGLVADIIRVLGVAA